MEVRLCYGAVQLNYSVDKGMLASTQAREGE